MSDRDGFVSLWLLAAASILINLMKKRRVEVNDRMQSNYVYFCTEPIGKNFHPDFQPELTPKEMLELGASVPLQCGARRVGSITKTRAVGFNGIAAITWGAGVPTTRQIKRWRAIRRQIAQIEKHCPPGELECRPKQRQAVLHWAYDSRKI